MSAGAVGCLHPSQYVSRREPSDRRCAWLLHMGSCALTSVLLWTDMLFLEAGRP